MRRTAALALAAGTIGVLAPLALADQADLDLRRLTLYRSGVGYFEWRGMVDGDAEVELRFSQEQINDILKSMVLLDLGGGRIEAVEYNSKEPLERRLASFAVDISDNPRMSELLSRLRGARVTVETNDGPITGTIVGTEQRTEADRPGEEPVRQSYVSLLTDRGIRTVPIKRLVSFRIEDDQLAAELERALAALNEQRSENVQSIDLRFRGDNARQVVVGYVHETPVWKTSYRLILPEDENGGDPTLQGWAIVENTTDEDWENVTLSLVSGRPVGFTMDLAEPMFLARPQMPVPVERGVRPRTYEGEVGNAPEMDASRVYQQGGQSGGGGRGTSPFQSRGDEMMDPAPNLNSFRSRLEPGSMPDLIEALDADAYAKYAAQAQATGGDVGEVFQYTLDAPVTIDRRRSAMLPILSAGVEGRRVSIYNQSDNPKHPMRGIEITNSSGLQLMPGPVSVIDGSAYAGDAQIGHVPAGGERLLAYAVDLDVSVTSETEMDRSIVGLSIADGLLVRRESREQTERYTVTNEDQNRERTVIIETAKLAGWDLVSPAESSAETDTALRFEVEADAGGSAELVITRRNVARETIGLVSANIRELVMLSRDGKVSQEVIEAVRRAQQLQASVQEAEREVRGLERERSEITAEQERIRSNMGAIDRTSDLYRRYLDKLGTQETRLEELEAELERARQRREAAAAELSQYLRNLRVE